MVAQHDICIASAEPLTYSVEALSVIEEMKEEEGEQFGEGLIEAFGKALRRVVEIQRKITEEVQYFLTEEEVEFLRLMSNRKTIVGVRGRAVTVEICSTTLHWRVLKIGVPESTSTYHHNT